MDEHAGNNRGRMRVETGKTTPRDLDDLLEKEIRALFFAMRGRNGKSLNKNFRNIARGHVKMIATLKRRIQDAKAARNDAHNYPLVKQSIRAIDEYVDDLFNRKQQDREKAV